MANESSIRSAPSRNPSYIRFVNRTTRTVIVKWFDYGGSTVDYGTLKPNDFNDIITFEGHPWKCEDAVTKTRLLLNKLEIFYAAPKYDPENAENSSFMWNSSSYCPNFNGFEYVYITLPVMSLWELSAEVVIRNVRAREDIMSLKIPKYLKNSLESKYH